MSCWERQLVVPEVARLPNDRHLMGERQLAAPEHEARPAAVAHVELEPSEPRPPAPEREDDLQPLTRDTTEHDLSPEPQLVEVRRVPAGSVAHAAARRSLSAAMPSAASGDPKRAVEIASA